MVQSDVLSAAYICRLPAPDSLQLSGTEATWAEVTNAYSYAVKLSRDGAEIASDVVLAADCLPSPGYDFASVMRDTETDEIIPGTYTFTVKAIASEEGFADSYESSINVVVS
jgi:hypothetical protein